MPPLFYAGSVPRMLDAVCGYTVKRIRAKNSDVREVGQGVHLCLNST